MKSISRRPLSACEWHHISSFPLYGKQFICINFLLLITCRHRKEPVFIQTGMYSRHREANRKWNVIGICLIMGCACKPSYGISTEFIFHLLYAISNGNIFRKPIYELKNNRKEKEKPDSLYGSWVLQRCTCTSVRVTCDSWKPDEHLVSPKWY